MGETCVGVFVGRVSTGVHLLQGLQYTYSGIYRCDIFYLMNTRHVNKCVVVQSLSCPTLCDHMDCSTPGFPSFTISQSFLKLMPVESVMPSNHLISVVPFSSCLQSSPASGSFQMSQLFASVGQVLEFQLQYQSFQ